MTKIWIIVEEKDETYGMGNFGICHKIATRDAYNMGGPHPAFLSKKEADNYINSLTWNDRYTPMQFEVK